MAQKTVELLAHCPNLTHCDIAVQLDMRSHFVSINKLKNLTTLTLSDSFKISGSHFVDILRRCPYLERVVAEIAQPGQVDRDQLPALPNLRSLSLTSSRAHAALPTLPYFDGVGDDESRAPFRTCRMSD
jgi:hypothetical protein